MKLYDVQREALRRCGGARGFGYFMEMGLGKTLTAEADFLERVAEGNADRSVVVCPNSFKSGWVDEIEKQGLAIAPCVFESGSNHHVYWANRPTNMPKQLIVNYEAIRSEKTMRFLIEFVSGRNGFLIFDESVQLKGHNSLQTKAAIELQKHFKYARILTGKPIVQGPHDLWGQMRAMGHLGGKNFFAFRNAFCRMGGFKMKQVVGPQNEEILASLIEPHVFRATKAEWTDLPPKSYTIRDYKLTPEMKAMYDQMLHEFVLWLNENESVAVDVAITKYMKLAQIQCGFIYDEDRNTRWLVSDDKNPRLALLEDIVDNELSGKACVVYHHKPVLEMLLRRFVKYNPTFIAGNMRSEEVSANKAKFNDDPACRLIFLQDDASKYGHTLLGNQKSAKDYCSTTIFFENSYSLDTRSQIEDRNHRHGQEQDSVLYIDLSGTLTDRKMIGALQRKESMSEAVMSLIS